MAHYKVNQFGFYNYFNYRNEVFDAATQAIVFTGENGSGKTVSMQAIFPTIFTMSPYQLKNGRNSDFYTKAGEASFAWCEFKNDQGLQTLVLAYSKTLEGNVSRYGCILKPGVAGTDLNFKTNWTEFRKLNNQHIKAIYNRVADYKTAINKLFFGFTNLKDFDDYIDHMLNLGKPPLKLTNSVSELDEALKTSLPDLSQYATPDIVGSFITSALKLISERNERERLLNILDNLHKTKDWADLSNKPTLARISLKFGDAHTDLIQAQDRANRLETELATKNDKITQLQTEIMQTKADLSKDQGEKAALDTVMSTDIKNLKNQLQRALTEQKHAQSEVAIAQQDLTRLQADYDRTQKKFDQTQMQLSQTQAKLAKLTVATDSNLVSAQFKAHYPHPQETIAKQYQLISDLEQLNIANQKLLFKADEVKKALDSYDEDYYLDQIKRALSDLQSATYDFDEYEQLAHQVELFQQQFSQQLAQSQLDLRSQIQTKQALTERLAQLQNHEKPETTAVFQTGQQLFELVDFKPDVPPALQLKIESALKYSNLLYTLFDARQVETGLEFTGNTISPASRNLGQYLQGANEQVQAFLTEIALDAEDNLLYGSVKITHPSQAQITHIGESNRQAKRQADIAQVQAELTTCQKEIDRLENEVAEYDDMLSQLSRASFPMTSALEKAQDTLARASHTHQANQAELAQLQTQLATFQNQRDLLLGDFCPDLPQENAALHHFEAEFNHYLALLAEIDRQKEEQNRLKSELAEAQQRLTELNLDASQTRLDELKQRLLARDEEVAQIQAQIQDPDIQRKIARYEELQNSIPELQADISFKEKQVTDIANSVTALELRLETAQETAAELSDDFLELEELLETLHLDEAVSQASANDLKNNNQNKANLLAIAFTEINASAEYHVEQSELTFKSFESSNSNITDALYELQNIKTVTYQRYDKVMSLPELENQINGMVESYSVTADNEVQKLGKQLYTSHVFDLIHFTVDKARQLTKQISQSMKAKEQNEHISFYTVFEARPEYRSSYLTAFGDQQADAPAVRDAVDRLVYQLWEIIVENVDQPQEVLMTEFYRMFDYKKWFNFKIRFKRKGASDKMEDLTDRKLKTFSEGQRSRAILEPLTIVLSLDQEKMSHDQAPRIIIMDEAFSGLDAQQQGLLLESFYDIADNFIATGHNAHLVMPQNATTVSYFEIINHKMGEDQDDLITISRTIETNN